jgi:broad specificity phosphatase PhoE
MLNQAADKNTQYKVIYMARHGEGFHNAAETKYGTPAWNCYYGQLDGDGTWYWNDPELTQAGIDQTVKANNFWRSQIAEQKMPAPETFYSSPLTRCTDTAFRTFNSLGLKNFFPIIKEYLREGISMRTCDHRSNKTYIASRFPNFRFEQGFAELDPYWTGMRSETNEAEDLRNKRLLDDIFSNDSNTWISFTAHSGEISSLLRVLGHRSFSLSTGQAIPVLVKAYNNRRVPEIEPSVQSWYSYDTCTKPPVTSLGGQGCICEATGTFSRASTTSTTAASATAAAVNTAPTSMITAPPRRR